MSFKTKLNILEKGECLPVNCRICGGQIVPELSPRLLRSGVTPQGIILAKYGEGTKQFYLCTDSALYAYSTATNFVKICDFADNSPFMIEATLNDKPCVVIFNGPNAVCNSDSKFIYKYNYGANLRCGVWHCGRLFGADRQDGYKVRWSGAGGWADWDTGTGASGFLQLDGRRGEVLNIMEFGEKLLLVREFGLTLLNMFGDPENYSADITDTDAEKIYKNTAQVVEGKLIFFTEGGLRMFDGSLIKPLNHAYAGDISSPVCSAALGSKYFLSCKSKSLDGGSVLCYDVEEGESYLINLSADGLCYAGKMYAFNSQGSYALDNGGEYILTCANVDFGSGKQKTVTSLYIDGEGADAEINNGKISRRFKNVKGAVRPHIRGEKFTFKISGTKPVRGVWAAAEECNAI